MAGAAGLAHLPDGVTVLVRNQGSDSVLFGVSAALVFQIFSATNSSPQTTELFAKDRSATLMKWVRRGLWTSLAFMGVMAWRTRSLWPVFGGGSAGASMYWMYYRANKDGGGTTGKG